MREMDVSKSYFKRLVIAFILISILPLFVGICVILYANYAMTMEEYKKQVQVIADDSVQKLNDVLEEYRSIADNISSNPEIRSLLQDRDSGFAAAQIIDMIKPLQMGRENKIKIYVIDYDSPYADAELPNLYTLPVYDEWGVFYRMKQDVHETYIYSNELDRDHPDVLSLSLGKAIIGEHEEIIGVVLIDIFPQYLKNNLFMTKVDNTQFVLQDCQQVVVLDTTGQYETGKAGEVKAVNHDGYLLTQKTGNGFTISTVFGVSEFYSELKKLIRISAAVGCVTFGICVLGAAILARSLYQPMGTLVDSMREISNGNMELRLDEVNAKSEEMKLISTVFNGMLNQINLLLDKVVEQTKRQKIAEIKSLQAQISPHFLYNMLNEIKALAKLKRTDEIAEFAVHLGKLLRRSITYKENFTTVEEELSFVKEYLELQQIRYERNFEIEVEVEQSIMDCRIPTLILQPIVENSIVHGFISPQKGKVLKISGGKAEEAKIYLEVYDNGVGVEEQYMEYINSTEKSAGLYGGLGVENVQKRILLTYGKDYGIKIESIKDTYTKVRITLPYHKSEGRQV